MYTIYQILILKVCFLKNLQVCKIWYMWEQKWFYLKGCCFKKWLFPSVPVSGPLPSDPEWEHRSGNNSANHPGHPADWRDLHVLFKVSTLPWTVYGWMPGFVNEPVQHFWSRCRSFVGPFTCLWLRMMWTGRVHFASLVFGCVSMIMVMIKVPPADGRNLNRHFYEYECAGGVVEPL